MANLTRRAILQSSVISLAASRIPLEAGVASDIARKGRIRQSVCQWCYRQMSIDQLAQSAASIGLRGVDLLQPDDYEIPRRCGLVCTMGYAGGGEINKALNRTENHAAIEQAFRANIPRAAKAGVPNVITFSGNRAGLSDDEGARNTVAGLNRLKKIAEDHGVTICLELLNSKRDHHDYMCDHTAWGVRVAQEVNSPNVKLLYDIYHMQIMEGDLIETISTNIQWIGHFHTGGVPGRHELNGTQEVQWDAVMRAIADSGFRGYVAHEFIPTADPLASLKSAADLCDV
ncbi:MAG TPA: TIM barrel protein [Candidatus Sulfotelmatobacter sp.]|jgi:hydroxypyruvate isomerase|nr:TIM barrel protein [Candidatus Sulfotelmatobacter sp.]